MEYQYDDSMYVERRISLLESKIGERKKSIEAMIQKMAQYQEEIERKKEENRKIIMRRDALANQLRLYRKAIQLSSKSSKTLLQQTEELFDIENGKIYDLEEQITLSKNILEKVQKKAPSIRELLANLEIQIPEFKMDLLKFNFKDCLNTIYGSINKKLLLSLRTATFMEDQINAKKVERSKLMREVKALTPPKPNMQLEVPTKSQYKRAPRKEYRNSGSFDLIFLGKMFSNAKNILEKYQNSINILPSEQSPISSSNNSPVAFSRTPTAVARRNRSSARKSNRRSINVYSKTPDNKNANLSPLTSRASARLITTPIQLDDNNTNTAVCATARSGRRSQRRQQYKSVNLSSYSSGQLPNIELTATSSTNSYLQTRLSTLTDSISKLNALLVRVNKANDSMTAFKELMMKKIEDAKMRTVSIKPMSLPAVNDAIKQLRETKNKIQAEKDEVASLRMDIPDQWNGSPQGLLKWQKQLLEQKEKIENSMGQQITKQENQLKDLKVLTRKRLNSLRKLKESK